MRFGSQMNFIKNRLINCVDLSMEGTANRYGIIAYRIMMILTALRAYETGNYKGQLICTEEDFNNAFNIMDLYGQYSILAYESLNSFSDIEKKIQSLLKQNYSLRDIASVVFGDKSKYQKVNRIINKHQWN